MTTNQISRHRVDICRNFFPPPFQTTDISLTAHLAIYTHIPGHSLYFITKYREAVNHVIYGLFQDQYLTLGLDINLLTHVAIGNGLGDG